jgi:hypothetical protein
MDNYLIWLFVLLLILFIGMISEGRKTEVEKIERPGIENSYTLENPTNIFFIQYTTDILFALRSNIIINNISELITFWDSSNLHINLSYKPQVRYSPRFSINPLLSSVLKVKCLMLPNGKISSFFFMKTDFYHILTSK